MLVYTSDLLYNLIIEKSMEWLNFYMNKKTKNKSVILDSVTEEDKTIIRKVIVNGGIPKDCHIHYTAKNFETAKMKGQPMVISVPKKQVEMLKENYIKFLNNEDKNDEQR